MNKVELQAQSVLLGIDDSVLSADLAAKGVNSPSVMEVVKKHVAKVAGNNYTRDQKIAATKVGELPEQAQAEIARGVSKFHDGVRYIAGQLGAVQGTTELLRSAPNEAVGITNLDEGRMPAGFNMLVTGIALETGASGTDDNAATIKYSNIGSTGDFDAVILNSEIEITAGGKTILPSRPASDFFSIGESGQAGENGKRIVYLSAPRWIKSQEKIEVTFRQPGAGAYSTTYNYIKVSLLGPELGVSN